MVSFIIWFESIYIWFHEFFAYWYSLWIQDIWWKKIKYKKKNRKSKEEVKFCVFGFCYVIFYAAYHTARSLKQVLRQENMYLRWTWCCSNNNNNNIRRWRKRNEWMDEHKRWWWWWVGWRKIYWKKTWS